MSLNPSADRSDVLDSAFLHGTINVGNSAVLACVGVSNLSKRQTLVLYNDSNKDMYYGTSAVTTAGANKGILFASTETVTLNVGEYINVYVICASPGANSVIVQEFA